MTNNLNKTIFIILNLWLSYIAILSFFIGMSKWHWEINNHTIINYSLYFLLFLLCIVIYLKSEFNKYIFFNLSLFSLTYALGFLHLFIGGKFLIGNDYLMYQIYPYRKFVLSTFICLSIVYIAIEYLNYNEKVLSKYLKSIIIVVPINIALYFNYLSNPYYVLNESHFHELIFCTIETNLLALFFIGLYGYLLYRKEKPISEYINSIVAILFFFVVYDIADTFSEYLNFSLPSFSHFILTAILILLILLLTRKLHSLYSNFGKFYEGLKFSRYKLNIKIRRKKTTHISFMEWLRKYLNYFPNKFFFICLMIISSFLFICFFPEGYGKRLLFTLCLSVLLFVLYLNILYNKRKQTNNLM